MLSDTADFGSILICMSEIAAEENPSVPIVSNTVSENVLRWNADCLNRCVACDTTVAPTACALARPTPEPVEVSGVEYGPVPVATPVMAYSTFVPVSMAMVEPAGMEAASGIELAPMVVPVPAMVVAMPGVAVAGPIMPRRNMPTMSG